MKEIIREAVERRMPDKESIRINAMTEPKKAMPKKAYAVLAVAVMIAICTCIAVPMMINELEMPPVDIIPIETTLSTDTTQHNVTSDDTTRQNDTTTRVDDTTNNDTSEIGVGWPICMFHEDMGHVHFIDYCSPST